MYGKRSLWQWVVIYALIGAVVYAGVYYFLLRPSGTTTTYQLTK